MNRIKSLATERPLTFGLIVTIVFIILVIASSVLATLFGGEFPFHPELLILLPVFLITNLGEEIGWRGYALPKLLAQRSYPAW